MKYALLVICLLTNVSVGFSQEGRIEFTPRERAREGEQSVQRTMDALAPKEDYTRRSPLGLPGEGVGGAAAGWGRASSTGLWEGRGTVTRFLLEERHASKFSPAPRMPFRPETEDAVLMLQRQHEEEQYNTISIPDDIAIRVGDLTEFYEVNNRFLHDLGLDSTRTWGNNLHERYRREIAAKSSHASGSKSVAVTVASVGSTDKLVTVFSLAGVADGATLHGTTFLISPLERSAQDGLRKVFEAFCGGRVYVYGADSPLREVSAGCGDSAIEFIRRTDSPYSVQDFV